VDVIVYVETNFLMSVAMGREGRGDDLLAAVSASVRVAIPSGCYMESFSAFEDEQKRRNWFRAELDKQIGQLRRDTTSANAGTLLRRLEESRIANDQLLNDVQARLFLSLKSFLRAIDHGQRLAHFLDGRIESRGSRGQADDAEITEPLGAKIVGSLDVKGG
jgi:rRNA-processing protein FCF1